MVLRDGPHVGDPEKAFVNKSDSSERRSRLGDRTTEFPYGPISWAPRSSAINKMILTGSCTGGEGSFGHALMPMSISIRQIRIVLCIFIISRPSKEAQKNQSVTKVRILHNHLGRLIVLDVNCGSFITPPSNFPPDSLLTL